MAANSACVILVPAFAPPSGATRAAGSAGLLSCVRGFGD
jgi:hypothetical protein